MTAGIHIFSIFSENFSARVPIIFLSEVLLIIYVNQYLYAELTQHSL